MSSFSKGGFVVKAEDIHKYGSDFMSQPCIADDAPRIWRLFCFGLLIGLFLGLLLAATAFAQEHQHGVNDLPGWYSLECCNLQDCRPVPDNEIEFGFGANGQPVVFHKPTGAEFIQSEWKVSQDERYHVCTRVVNPGTENEYLAQYCVYLRAGA